jgi:hypothetical protein
MSADRLPAVSLSGGTWAADIGLSGRFLDDPVELVLNLEHRFCTTSSA